MTLDELTQKAVHAFGRHPSGSAFESMRAAVLFVLAEVREMVPDQLAEMADDSPIAGRAFTAGYDGCRAEMLRRLDQTMEQSK